MSDGNETYVFIRTQQYECRETTVYINVTECSKMVSWYANCIRVSAVFIHEYTARGGLATPRDHDSRYHHTVNDFSMSVEDASMIDDREANLPHLVRRVQSNDHDAFRALYEIYKRRAWHFALSLSRDESLSADIVQDTFIEVYRSIKGLRNPEAFQAWFYRVLYSKVLLHVKERQKHRVHVESVELDTRISEADPLDKILAKEENRQIWSAVNELGPSYRIVLVLRYLEGMSDAEIAAIVQSPIGTVKWRLHEGKARLIRILKSHTEKEGRP